MSRYNSVLELYGRHTGNDGGWSKTANDENCPFIEGTCKKTRKSSPDVTIGTCTVKYSKDQKNMCICPYRMLENGKVFTDCIGHMSAHKMGNELHVTSEVGVEGGSVDYFLVSANNDKGERKVSDFVGIELQALDTTGTVWPSRQEFIDKKVGLSKSTDIEDKSFGMNWKMTAKTSLVQMHHKIGTFDAVNRHLVLVLQDELLDYMRGEFTFSHFEEKRPENPLHIHSYEFRETEDRDGNPFVSMNLDEVISTDGDGVEAALERKKEVKVEEKEIFTKLEKKISEDTIFKPA